MSGMATNRASSPLVRMLLALALAASPFIFGACAMETVGEEPGEQTGERTASGPQREAPEIVEPTETSERHASEAASRETSTPPELLRPVQGTKAASASAVEPESTHETASSPGAQTAPSPQVSASDPTGPQPWSPAGPGSR
jgi:hypothetical protein